MLCLPQEARMWSGDRRGTPRAFGKIFMWFHHPKDILNYGDSQTVVDMGPLGERVKNKDSQKF